MQSIIRVEQKVYGFAITGPIPDTTFVFVVPNQFDMMPGFYNKRHVFNLLECQRCQHFLPSILHCEVFGNQGGLIYELDLLDIGQQE